MYYSDLATLATSSRSKIIFAPSPPAWLQSAPAPLTFRRHSDLPGPVDYMISRAGFTRDGNTFVACDSFGCLTWFSLSGTFMPGAFPTRWAPCSPRPRGEHNKPGSQIPPTSPALTRSVGRGPSVQQVGLRTRSSIAIHYTRNSLCFFICFFSGGEGEGRGTVVPPPLPQQFFSYENNDMVHDQNGYVCDARSQASAKV